MGRPYGPPTFGRRAELAHFVHHHLHLLGFDPTTDGTLDCRTSQCAGTTPCFTKGEHLLAPPTTLGDSPESAPGHVGLHEAVSEWHGYRAIWRCLASSTPLSDPTSDPEESEKRAPTSYILRRRRRATPAGSSEASPAKSGSPRAAAARAQLARPLPPSRRGPANGAAASRAGRLTSAAVAAPIGRRRCDARAARGLLGVLSQTAAASVQCDAGHKQQCSATTARPPPLSQCEMAARWTGRLRPRRASDPWGRPLNARRPPRSTPRARATKDGLSLPVNRFLTDHDDETGHGQTNHDIN